MPLCVRLPDGRHLDPAERLRGAVAWNHPSHWELATSDTSKTTEITKGVLSISNTGPVVYDGCEGLPAQQLAAELAEMVDF